MIRCRAWSNSSRRRDRGNVTARLLEDRPNSLRVSVVLETLTSSEAGLGRALSSLCLQAGAAPFEILAVADPASADCVRHVVSTFPEVQVVWSDHPLGYFQMKNLGAAKASGDILAFLDSDCVATSDWIRTIIEEFTSSPPHTAGIQGQTRYASGFWADAWTVHRFGQLYTDRIFTALPTVNNVAFRREVFLAYGFADSPLRDGVERILASALRNARLRLKLSSQMKVEHHFEASLAHLLRMGLANGCNYLLGARIIAPRVGRHAVRRLGLLAPFVCAARFAVRDTVNVFRLRRKFTYGLGGAMLYVAALVAYDTIPLFLGMWRAFARSTRQRRL